MRQADIDARAEREGITIEQAELQAQAERHDRVMARLWRRGWRP